MSDTIHFQHKSHVLTFSSNPNSRENTVNVLLAGSSITLDAAESNELLLWLYEKRDTFFQLEHQELLQAKQAADLADEQIIQAVRQKALLYFARDPKNEQKIEEIWIDSRAEDKVAV